MPWNQNGPSTHSNYDIAPKIRQSAEKLFHRKYCFEVIDSEVQKLLDQDFVIKVPVEEVDHSKPEWYLPVQAVFSPDRTTKVRHGKATTVAPLTIISKRAPITLTVFPMCFEAWRWNEVAYSGDVRKMFNQVLVHPDDQVYHRFLWRSKTSEIP